MNRLTKLFILTNVLLMFYCRPLHCEETDDKIKEIISNIPEVVSEFKYWNNKYEDKDFNIFRINTKKKIDLDGNKVPDYIVTAVYAEFCTADGGNRAILAVIKDLKTPVFVDYAQYFGTPEIITDIISGKECMFYREHYYAGYSGWYSKIVGLWLKPEILLNLDFSAYYSPIGSRDEDNFRFKDLDGDGSQEVILEHILWTYKETIEEDLMPVLNKKDYRVLKYDGKKKQLIEIKDKRMLETARQLYNNGIKKEE